MKLHGLPYIPPTPPQQLPTKPAAARAAVTSAATTAAQTQGVAMNALQPISPSATPGVARGNAPASPSKKASARTTSPTAQRDQAQKLITAGEYKRGSLIDVQA